MEREACGSFHDSTRQHVHCALCTAVVPVLFYQQGLLRSSRWQLGPLRGSRWQLGPAGTTWARRHHDLGPMHHQSPPGFTRSYSNQTEPTVTNEDWRWRTWPTWKHSEPASLIHVSSPDLPPSAGRGRAAWLTAACAPPSLPAARRGSQCHPSRGPCLTDRPIAPLPAGSARVGRLGTAREARRHPTGTCPSAGIRVGLRLRLRPDSVSGGGLHSGVVWDMIWERVGGVTGERRVMTTLLPYQRDRRDRSKQELDSE